MTDARRTHQEATDFTQWLTDRHHSNYGENDYIILRGAGTLGVNFVYLFQAHLVVGGGTGKHMSALRQVLGEAQQTGKEAMLGVQRWLVIGPAHDGERRALPFTSDTRTNCEIRAEDGYQYNDSRSVPGAS